MLSVRPSGTMYIPSHLPPCLNPTSQRSPEKKQASFYPRARCRIKLPSGLTCSSLHIQSLRMHGPTYTGRFTCYSRNMFPTFASMEAGGAAFHSGANSIPILPANGMLSPNQTRIQIISCS
jgi:hypothetical protein